MVVEKGVLFSMKSTCKLLVKVFVLIAFLYLTPFASGLKHCFRNADDLLNNFVYKQKTINSSLSLKDSLNVLSYNSNLTIPKEVAKNIVLMELGGDVNTFEEVSNSLDVIADGIHDVLTKE